MTEKILRRHLRRVWFHWDRLQVALNDAHNADVIVYPRDIPVGGSVCDALWMVRERFEQYTKDQVARTIQSVERSRV